MSWRISVSLRSAFLVNFSDVIPAPAQRCCMAQIFDVISVKVLCCMALKKCRMSFPRRRESRKT
ncbi:MULTISPECIES: hypothetical protein [unclassified Rickettsia]|uniref:hypothetical protein n=1 Tax=unclassified Rickettsia TaxID=114295 RepID=UPI0031334CAC